MSAIQHLETISELHHLLGLPVQHPLLSAVDLTHYTQQFSVGERLTLGFYAVIFKQFRVNGLRYGQQPYDFQDGSLICISPKQVITLDAPTGQLEVVSGWGVFFHPNLVRGTSLGPKMKDYSFFAYSTNEALHLADKEKQTLGNLVKQLMAELADNLDRHSRTLLTSTLELLLNYCTRYYDRQFITRQQAHTSLLAQVEEVLIAYFQHPDLAARGLPTVKYLADQLCLSPDYLSDLLRRELGMSAQERIHYHLLEEAKNQLLNTDKSVGELAYALGFDYPHYFSRLFKSKTGLTPLAFRNLN
jgi:AraC-like DNA-binding protein